MRRGDIILALFPNTDGFTATRRPALIVQADNLNTGIPQILLACITSNKARSGHPSRITLLVGMPAHQLAGLTADSVIMTDNIATIPEYGVLAVIGSLDESSLRAVDTALRHTLGLTE